MQKSAKETEITEGKGEGAVGWDLTIFQRDDIGIIFTVIHTKGSSSLSKICPAPSAQFPTLALALSCLLGSLLAPSFLRPLCRPILRRLPDRGFVHDGSLLLRLPSARRAQAESKAAVGLAEDVFIESSFFAPPVDGARNSQ